MYAKKDYFYHLPTSKIAKYPLANRSDSKLLVVGDGKNFIDTNFNKLSNYLAPGDLLVINNTKVVPARLIGKKITGAKAEILIEKKISKYQALALIKTKNPQIGNRIKVGQVQLELLELSTKGWIIESPIDLDLLVNKYGEIPIPPYLERAAEKSDIEQYQTIFAKKKGAVAAPTAGLHFDNQLIESLINKNIELVELSLQIGAGTFIPLRSEDIRDHKLHSEYFEVNSQAIEKIKSTKLAGKKIIALGTTALRALETIAGDSYESIKPQKGYTDIYITPLHNFKLVDRLITNFHQPYSTLLVLVSAFTGKDLIFKAYEHALKSDYRFLSYGDGMLIDCHSKE